jgi:uncharacterized protein YtpQ (UPF0354 family)
MYNICSASGITTNANEDIMTAIRNATLLKNSTSEIFPLVLRKVNIFLKSNSVVYFNTSDGDIALGLNKTFVKESFSGSGEFVIATNIQDILIKRIVIEDPATEWEITFLY